MISDVWFRRKSSATSAPHSCHLSHSTMTRVEFYASLSSDPKEFLQSFLSYVHSHDILVYVSNLVGSDIHVFPVLLVFNLHKFFCPRSCLSTPLWQVGYRITYTYLLYYSYSYTCSLLLCFPYNRCLDAFWFYPDYTPIIFAWLCASWFYSPHILWRLSAAYVSISSFLDIVQILIGYPLVIKHNYGKSLIK